MKRIVTILLTLLLLLGGTALADMDIDLTQMTEQELKTLIEQAQQELTMLEERRIKQAIELLKADCMEKSQWLLQEDGTYATDGYLEILHTQVIYIRDEIRIEADDPKEAEYLQTQTEEYFGGVECIVEFVILADYGYGFQPTSYSAVCFNPSVIFMKDGSVSYSFAGWMNRYRSMYYNTDFNPIIESISDRNYEFNNTWYLLK